MPVLKLIFILQRVYGPLEHRATQHMCGCVWFLLHWCPTQILTLVTWWDVQAVSTPALARPCSPPFARTGARVCVRVCGFAPRAGCLALTDPHPVPDVHHKHNQDKEQSSGQTRAVPGDPLLGLPDGPQSGL